MFARQLVSILFIALLVSEVVACKPKQADSKRKIIPRDWGRSRPSLLIPDSALYQLANYLMHHHTMHWATGDSVFAYYRHSNAVLACTGPDADKGPNVSKQVLVNLLNRKIVTPADTVFFRQQQANTRGVSLDGSKMLDCVVVPIEEIDSAYRDRGARIHEKYGRFINKIGLPLFSSNYQVAIIDIGYDCGSLCSTNYTLVLYRKGKSWQVVELLEYSIS
ncbi:MAG: hypothetical protein EOO56_01520 [Hymenobacter sp.]|nr:MAG: hypothetical protein EOO56_01520 [Hymenobacter sp.]